MKQIERTDACFNTLVYNGNFDKYANICLFKKKLYVLLFLYFNFKHITNYTIMNKYVTMQTHSLNLPQLGRRHLKNIQDLLHSFRYIC